jgi:hypothetical protein
VRIRALNELEVVSGRNANLHDSGLILRDFRHIFMR